MKFEVVVLPVTDADRAKAFYQGLGWRLDADIHVDERHRAELMGHGARVSDVWHGPGLDNVEHRVVGRDPDGQSYRSFATFTDPDGNSWLLQEITERLPGRVWQPDIGALAELLHETSERHGSFEAVAPAHNWWDWYAAYMDARSNGSTPDAASAAAGSYMAKVKHIVA